MHLPERLDHRGVEPAESLRPTDHHIDPHHAAKILVDAGQRPRGRSPPRQAVGHAIVSVEPSGHEPQQERGGTAHRGDRPGMPDGECREAVRQTAGMPGGSSQPHAAEGR